MKTFEQMRNDGPWKDEPDFLCWIDRDIPCVIIRNLQIGHLCGYLGVSHEIANHSDDYDVHGGFTYIDSALNIRTVNLQDELNNLPGFFDKTPNKWIGFDCGHFSDLTPTMRDFIPGGIYRDINYVKNELKSVVDQIVNGIFK